MNGGPIATQNHRGLRPWKGDYHLWDHEHYATSDLGTATGTMKSAVFTIPTADQMTFYISGFDGPDPNPAGQSLVRLVRASDLAVLFQEFCPQSTRWERVAWDVFPHAGTDVFIDVVDGNPSATEGWIAVDDFELGTDEVLSPWPSVTTTGDTVHVWGRDYDWGVLPLPEQVSSGGTDLLAGPMRLDAAVSGQPVSWTPAGGQAADAALTTPSGAAATIQRSATGRGVRVDGFAVTEFDGMIRVDLTFSPVSGPVTLNHLYVEIPLDPQVADLMYLYYVPFYGQRTAGAAASFTGPFQSIAWLGDEERGLTWFAESDKGWLPSGNTGAVRVIPGAQETVLQLRIWNQSHTLVRLVATAGPGEPGRKGDLVGGKLGGDSELPGSVVLPPGAVVGQKTPVVWNHSCWGLETRRRQLGRGHPTGRALHRRGGGGPDQ